MLREGGGYRHEGGGWQGEGADDRRKIVANDGEVKAASFFLFASCLRATGCPDDDGTGEILVSAVLRRKTLMRKMFRSI